MVLHTKYTGWRPNDVSASATGGLISGSLADSRLGRRGTVAFACVTSVAGPAGRGPPRREELWLSIFR